jgi:hypothetical protein
MNKRRHGRGYLRSKEKFLVRTGSVGNFVDVQLTANLPGFATFFTVGTDPFYSLVGECDREMPPLVRQRALFAQVGM